MRVQAAARRHLARGALLYSVYAASWIQRAARRLLARREATDLAAGAAFDACETPEQLVQFFEGLEARVEARDRAAAEMEAAKAEARQAAERQAEARSKKNVQRRLRRGRAGGGGDGGGCAADERSGGPDGGETSGPTYHIDGPSNLAAGPPRESAGAAAAAAASDGSRSGGPDGSETGGPTSHFDGPSTLAAGPPATPPSATPPAPRRLVRRAPPSGICCVCAPVPPSWPCAGHRSCCLSTPALRACVRARWALFFTVMVPLAPGRVDRAFTQGASAHRDKVASFWFGDNGKAYCEKYGVDEGVAWRMWCNSPPVFAVGVESCDRHWPGSREECARRERLQRAEQQRLASEPARLAAEATEQSRQRWLAARDAAMTTSSSGRRLRPSIDSMMRSYGLGRRCRRGLSAREARGPACVLRS